MVYTKAIEKCLTEMAPEKKGVLTAVEGENLNSSCP